MIPARARRAVLACAIGAGAASLPGGATAARAASQGEAVFKRYCAMCHSTDPGKNRVGPSLAGVVGRAAGAAPGFSYSAANANSGIVWTKDKLQEYLADPQAVVPGTLMLFPGLKNPDDRAAVVEFLAEQPAD